MLEFTQKQLKQIAKLDWVKDITQRTEADKVSEPLEYVAYACGQYGVSGKMWRGRETGDIYVAYGYSATIYKF